MTTVLFSSRSYLYRTPLVLVAVFLAVGYALLVAPNASAATARGSSTLSGGTGPGGQFTASAPARDRSAANQQRKRKPRPLTGWVGKFTTTEYHPTPERWFSGPRQAFPGLLGRHRVAWLLSAHGVAMEGDGWAARPTGPGTRWVNYVSGTAGWINARGRPTRPGGPFGWSNGAPAWLACGWKNKRGGWTFPRNYLQRGEAVRWANGRPARWTGCDRVNFKAGVGRKLRFWNSVAVDPSLFPLGRTWFYLPAYRDTRCGGWFRADDTGGAIRGRHIDVHRPPPPAPVTLTTRQAQKVLIVRGKKPAANPCR